MYQATLTKSEMFGWIVLITDTDTQNVQMELFDTKIAAAKYLQEEVAKYETA